MDSILRFMFHAQAAKRIRKKFTQNDRRNIKSKKRQERCKVLTGITYETFVNLE